jgi:Ca-activated chloride channel family protein
MWGAARAAFCVLAVMTAAVSADQSAFRAGTETVPLYVTVIGQAGRLVTDLSRDAFQVLDNDRPQPLTIFDSGVQRISIVVMLDMSGSMLGHTTLLRNAAVQMFTRLGPGDRARVGNFGERIVISPTFTNNVDELIRTVWLDLKPGGPTPLWGAVNAAMAALARVDGRRVVLVLSDGKNSPRAMGGSFPGPSLEDVTRRAQTEGFMVYGIGLHSRGGRGRGQGASSAASVPRFSTGDDEPDPGLRQIAHESGGGYFELQRTDDLGEVFARVADELHRQYLLGFTAPEADGKLHKVQVRLKDPRMIARARQTYQAPGGR